MNPLLKKEIRLLLPGWAASLLFALAIWLTPHDLPDNSPIAAFVATVLLWLLCPATLVMTTLGSFGGEVSAGTFSSLLAQPVARARIWRTKTLLLAAAVASVWVVWCVSYSLHFPVQTFPRANALHFWLFSGLYAMTVYSGGLWAVLLFRQVTAAFWFALLIPLALCVTTGMLLPTGVSDQTETNVLALVLLAYGVAGFGWARWLFLRAQDAHWMGGPISLPALRGLKWQGESRATAIGSSAASPHRIWRPRLALLIKELQLHQSEFVIAGMVALLHLAAIVARHVGHFNRNSTIGITLDNYWLLWLLMPLLIGCAAVAEERRLGTLEGQLCLPVKRRTQFAVKVVVVVALSIVFGLIAPMVFEGNRILPDIRFNPAVGLLGLLMPYTGNGPAFMAVYHVLASPSPWCLSFFTMCLIVSGIGALALYASSQTRNTLQTLGPALLGILLTFALSMTAYEPDQLFGYQPWSGWLIYLIGVPVMLAVLTALAYWNYQQVPAGWSLWRRNLITFTFSLALVMAVTTAVYHRVWELFTRLEPQLGAGRLTQIETPKMENGFGNLMMVFPDGRLWGGDPWASSGHYLEGANWAKAVETSRDIVAIQRDGTLWIGELPTRLVGWRPGEKLAPPAAKLVPFGSDRHWKDIVNVGDSAFLLKTDGSLWFWGTNRWVSSGPPPELRNFTPLRLGTNSDWAQITSASGRLYFRKTDGQIWVMPPYSRSDPKLQLFPDDLNYDLGHAAYLDTAKWRSLMTAYREDGGGLVIATLEDGTLHVLARLVFNPRSRAECVAQDVRIGTDTNWVTVAGFGDRVVTLKRDGSLWQWNFCRNLSRGWLTKAEVHGLQNATPVEFGTHPDWVAMAGVPHGLGCLAADGSVWYWPLARSSFYVINNGDHDLVPLLDFSLKPHLLGNVLSGAN